MEPKSDQIKRFRQAAGDLECDEDEMCWDATVKKVAKQKPASEKPE